MQFLFNCVKQVHGRRFRAIGIPIIPMIRDAYRRLTARQRRRRRRAGPMSPRHEKFHVPEQRFQIAMMMMMVVVVRGLFLHTGQGLSHVSGLL